MNGIVAHKIEQPPSHNIINGFVTYANPAIGIRILYPSTWLKYENNNGSQVLFVYSLSERFSYSALLITSKPLLRQTLYDFVGKEINNYKNLTEFKLIHSDASNDGKTFNVVFNFADPKLGTHYTEMNLYTKKAEKVYLFQYTEEVKRFATYLPIVLKIVNSSNIQEKDGQAAKPGIGVNNEPYGLAVIPDSNRVYVANFGSNEVSVIDGITDTLQTAIPVDKEPLAISVIPLFNKLYVTNTASNTLSIIDGTTNKVVGNVPVGKNPSAVTVDPGSALIFVANADSDTVSVIDGIREKVARIIQVGHGPFGLGINPVTKTLYVANSGDNTVSVIDYSTSGTGGFSYAESNLTVGTSPGCVTVNPNTNLVYVCNRDDNTVSIINGSTNKEVIIPVGDGPYAAAVNPNTDKVYVADWYDDKVSVIDGSTNREKTIRVDVRPSGVAVNPLTNLTYVSNDLSNTVYVINGVTDKISVGINFKIDPPASGTVICNGYDISEDAHRIYDIGTSLNCHAKENHGFIFSSWSGELPSRNLRDISSIMLNVSKYGSLVAHFTQAPAQVMIPTDFLYAVVLGPTVGASLGGFLAWYIPYIMNKRSSKNKDITKS